MKTQTLAKVTAGGARLRIRSGPGIRHDVIGYCRDGERIKIAGWQRGAWLEIETQGGKKGFVAAAFVETRDSA